MKEQHGWITLQRLMNQFCRFLGLFLRRSYTNLHIGSIIEFNQLKSEVQCLFVLANGGFRDELFIGLPFAFLGGDDGAFNCGLTFGLEIIHDWLADSLVFLGHLKQFQPGFVHFSNDAFLNAGNGARRALHIVVELTPVFGGGIQGRVQGALDSEGAKFTRHDGL